jgi:hypothetical protein
MKMKKPIYVLLYLAIGLGGVLTVHSCKKDVKQEQQEALSANSASNSMTTIAVCDQIVISQSEIDDVGHYHNEGLDYLNQHLDTNILYSYTDTTKMIKYIGSISKNYVKSINFQPVLDLQNIGLLDSTIDAALDQNLVNQISFNNTEQIYITRLDSIIDSNDDTILNIAPLEAYMIDVENDANLDKCSKGT